MDTGPTALPTTPDDLPTVPVPDLRRFLAGRWHLSRAILDRRAGQTGRLEGEASFSPAPAAVETGPAPLRVGKAADAVPAAGSVLVWQETGRMRLGGFESEVFRVYRCWFPAPAHGEIRFPDGRLFHPLDLTDGTCAVRHPCGDDLYLGLYRALDADRLQVHWTVTGPRKDYALDSLYQRAPQHGWGIPDPA